MGGHLSHAISFHNAYWHPEGVLYHWLLTDWPPVCRVLLHEVSYAATLPL